MINRYYNLVNEGGEGYRPAQQESGEPMWSILAGKADKAQRILNGTSWTDPRLPQLKAEYDQLRAAADASMKAA